MRLYEMAANDEYTSTVMMVDVVLTAIFASYCMIYWYILLYSVNAIETLRILGYSSDFIGEPM